MAIFEDQPEYVKEFTKDFPSVKKVGVMIYPG